MLFFIRPFLRHLEEEIAYLREQVEHERQRAELAVDELLRVRVQAGPVTQPTASEAKARETLVDQLLKEPEFALAGNADAP